MAGSWETQPTVLVAVLHTEQVTFHWALGLRNLQFNGSIAPISGMPFDHARNTACQAALDHGFDYLFFLDSDVIPPSNAIQKLLSHNLPFVSGMYSRRSPPHAVPVMMRNGQWVTQFPKGKLIEVDVVGAGCMLIRRDVLQRMPPVDAKAGKHWFHWRSDMAHSLPPGEAMSEDYVFCKKIKETLGIPIVVDTSVECRHVGLAEATFGNFVPANCNPHT